MAQQPSFTSVRVCIGATTLASPAIKGAPTFFGNIARTCKIAWRYHRHVSLVKFEGHLMHL